MDSASRTGPAKRSGSRGRGEAVFDGIAASPGIAIGRVFVLGGAEVRVPRRKLATGALKGEEERFRKALDEARADLGVLRESVAHRIGDGMARILDTHLMILQDDSVIDETVETMRREQRSVESAFSDVVGRVADSLSANDDEYFRERAGDLRDVCRRVLRILVGLPGARVTKLKSNAVVVANEISPSDATALPHNKVSAFVCDVGGRTSHTAIFARSLGIPAVVGLGGVSAQMREDDLVVVDGLRGKVIVNPTDGTLRDYKREERKFSRMEKKLTALSELPPLTLDHHAFELSANVDLPGEVAVALEKGARGIGLYRTEFLYLLKGKPPTEEEQVLAFSDAAQRMAPESVIFRTLDLGADKLLPSVDRREANPFLGYRGIRRSLSETEMFEGQLRAILRASVTRNVKIMLPMITGLEEVEKARELFERVKAKLRAEGVPFDPNVGLGIMIETPSAALLADAFAREVDFFSIGTNDLIQYTLAIDRGNDRVAHLYDPFHPAVLRTISRVVEAAKDARIWVGVCGEMASDPLALLFLIGIGVDEISTSPYMVPHTKNVIRSVYYEDLRLLSRALLKMRMRREARQHVIDFVERKLPDLKMYVQP